MLLEKMKIENGRAVTKDVSREREVYRGYLIIQGEDGFFYVSKGIGRNLCACLSITEAKREIDKIKESTKDADIPSLQRQLEQARREGDTAWVKELEGEIEDLKRENESQAKDEDFLQYKGYVIEAKGEIDKLKSTETKANSKDACRIKDISLGGKGYKCMKCGATDVMPGLIKHKAKDADPVLKEKIKVARQKLFEASRPENIRKSGGEEAVKKLDKELTDLLDRVEDASPIDITISVNDPDGSLIAFLKGLARTANPGHSFEVIMDPDGGNGPQKFGFDGDGSFRIHSINGSEDFKTEDGWDTPLKEEIRELEEALAVNKRDPNMKNLAARQEEKIKKLKEDLQYKYDHP